MTQNGYTLVAPHDDLYQFALDIANSKLGKEQIEEWLRAHCIPLSPGD